MSWAKRNVPFRVWLPLVLVLSFGVVVLKVRTDPHRGMAAMMQRHTDSINAVYRRQDSLMTLATPRRQHDLAVYMRALCDSMTADSTLRRTLEFGDFYGPGRLTEGWVARFWERDSLSTMSSEHLKFTIDSLTDSIRSLLPALHGRAVRFNAKFRFRDSDDISVCNPWIRVKLVAIAALDSMPVTTGAGHAAAH